MLASDAFKRKNRNVAPGGTITRTVWTTPQWIASVWVGTNDTGTASADPTGGGAAGNNMVIVTLNQYDGGSAGGDGNLTEETKYVSAAPGDTRVTGFGYDFRDQRTSTTDALGGYALDTLDNLGRATLTQRYASLGGNLIEQSGKNFDARGRAYQTLVYGVDPTTGTVGNVLTGNTWFDPSGNTVQSIAAGDGQIFTKNAINGLGAVIATYRGYNTSGVSYAQAQTVAGDVIVEQTELTLDEAGNNLSTASFQRLNDTPANGAGSTGALTYATQPMARVSYAAGWFDGIDRPIANGNYGAIASFTRPDTPPASSATVLVTAQNYDSASRPYQATDAKGIVNGVGYDNASRTVETVEDVGGLARTTKFGYTLDNLPAFMKAVNSITGDQTTTWTRGTTLAESGVARNDLVRYVDYPGGVSGSDRVAYAYNRLSQERTITDQLGTVHALFRDKLGRETNDCVSTLGAGVDGAVLQIAMTYEPRGMLQTITSFDSATQNSGTILNQVQLAYNDFGQPTTDQQEHSGAVTSSTPKVQNTFADGASGSNQIRPTGLIYPSLRTIASIYGTPGGMNDILNRIETLRDTATGTDLATYLYLGLGTVIRITYPKPGVWLDLWGGTGGVLNGIDLFGRIVDQRWQNNVTTTPVDIDRYKYGYDQNSNRVWKANVVGTAAVPAGLDEFYTMDPLNRLTDVQRGVINGTNTGITGTPAKEQNWALDPTGNWPNFVTKTSGVVDLNQGRTSNPVNEITGITASDGTPVWITPAYDAAGNMTTMPQPANPTSSYTAVYDAWRRVTAIGAGTSPVGKYQYDGRGFRIMKLAFSLGSLSETRHFYFTNTWQDIEQRVGSSNATDQQHVWGIRYIDELVCRYRAANTSSSSSRSSGSSRSSMGRSMSHSFALQDANFNITTLTGMAGTVQERLVYDPYGTDTAMTAAWTDTVDTYAWCYRFQGALIDPSTQIYHFRNRDYSSGLGRWHQQDPMGYGRTTNLYEYVRSLPTTNLDPFGLDTLDSVLPALPTLTVPAPLIVLLRLAWNPWVLAAILALIIAEIARQKIRNSRCEKGADICRNAAHAAAFGCSTVGNPGLSGPAQKVCFDDHYAKFDIWCNIALKSCLDSWFGDFVMPAFVCFHCVDFTPQACGTSQSGNEARVSASKLIELNSV